MDEGLSLLERAPEFLPPFEVPRDLLYRPPEDKMNNATKLDFLGSAKVVASVEATDTYAGFSGKQLKVCRLESLPVKQNMKQTGFSTIRCRHYLERDLRLMPILPTVHYLVHKQ